jgi:hypothetical protein
MGLPQQRRSALEYQFNGVQAVHIHQNHPYYANPVLGQYQMMSCSIAPFGLVTIALASILFCCKVLQLHELGILC